MRWIFPCSPLKHCAWWSYRASTYNELLQRLIPEFLHQPITAVISLNSHACLHASKGATTRDHTSTSGPNKSKNIVHFLILTCSQHVGFVDPPVCYFIYWFKGTLLILRLYCLQFSFVFLLWQFLFINTLSFKLIT